MLYLAEVTVKEIKYFSYPEQQKLKQTYKHTVEAKDLNDAEWKIKNYYQQKNISNTIAYDILNIEFFIHIN